MDEYSSIPAATDQRCPALGLCVSDFRKSDKPIAWTAPANISLAFSASSIQAILRFATASYFHVGVSSSKPTTDTQTACAMTQTILPDEDDVRDFVQDYSDIKRMAPSRANDLLDKIMADTQPAEPDPDVSFGWRGQRKRWFACMTHVQCFHQSRDICACTPPSRVKR